MQMVLSSSGCTHPFCCYSLILTGINYKDSLGEKLFCIQRSMHTIYVDQSKNDASFNPVICGMLRFTFQRNIYSVEHCKTHLCLLTCSRIFLRPNVQCLSPFSPHQRFPHPCKYLDHAPPLAPLQVKLVLLLLQQAEWQQHLLCFLAPRQHQQQSS